MKKRKVRKILEEAQEKHPTDVLGSWTGVPWLAGAPRTGFPPVPH